MDRNSRPSPYRSGSYEGRLRSSRGRAGKINIRLEAKTEDMETLTALSKLTPDKIFEAPGTLGIFQEKLTLLANKEHAEAQFQLGRLYKYGGAAGGRSRDNDEIEPMGWLEKAAAQGHKEAEVLLGNIYAQENRYGPALHYKMLADKPEDYDYIQKTCPLHYPRSLPIVPGASRAGIEDISISLTQLLSELELQKGIFNPAGAFVEKVLAIEEMYTLFSKVSKSVRRISDFVEGIKNAAPGFMINIIVTPGTSDMIPSPAYGICNAEKKGVFVLEAEWLPRKDYFVNLGEKNARLIDKWRDFVVDGIFKRLDITLRTLENYYQAAHAHAMGELLSIRDAALKAKEKRLSTDYEDYVKKFEEKNKMMEESPSFGKAQADVLKANRKAMKTVKKVLEEYIFSKKWVGKRNREFIDKFKYDISGKMIEIITEE